MGNDTEFNNQVKSQGIIKRLLIQKKRSSQLQEHSPSKTCHETECVFQDVQTVNNYIETFPRNLRTAILTVPKPDDIRCMLLRPLQKEEIFSLVCASK